MKNSPVRIITLLIILLAVYGNALGVTKTSKTGSKSWNSTGSWTPSGVPAAGDDVIIQSGSLVTINANTSNLASVTIQSGGTLTHGTGTFTLNVAGNFTNNGTYTVGLSTVVFTGTTASTQIISGSSVTSFNNITVSNGSNSIDVQVTSPQQLVGILTVSSGAGFDVSGSGSFTLISTNDEPDATGSIAALTGGASVTGDITVQRLISQEGRLYRYVSTPVSGVTVADWADDFIITGFSGAPTTDPVTGLNTVCGTTIVPTSPSMYYYNESTAGTVQNGWTKISGTSQSIEVGRGYSPFIRETCYRNVLISVSGTVNQGTIALPVSFTNSSSADDGWNLIGNPYPSAIRWDADGNGWTKGADLSTSVDVRDNASGAFVTLVEGDAIAQGQAFWVKANGADFGLSIDETAKVSPGTGSSFYRVAESKRDLLKINLTNGDVTDYAYYRMVDGASNDFERNDFLNQNNDLFDVATLIGSQQVAVNSVGSVSCGTIIPVYVKDMTTGTYAFSIGREGIFAGMDAVLKDKFTGTTTNLSQTENYQFDVTADAASKACDRFEIELAMLKVAQAENGTICRQGTTTLTASGNYEDGNYHWYESSESTTPLSQGASFVTSELSSTKTYYVAAVNALGCEGVRVPVLAEVMQYEDATITVTKKNVLSSNSVTGNQWYLNDVLIEGATEQSVSVTESGTYKVSINHTGCITSGIKEYRMLHIKDGESIAVFPNPIRQNQELQVQVVAENVGNTQLINSVGRVVAELKMTLAAPGVWTVYTNLSELPTGFYFVRTLADNIPSTIKLVKAQE